MQRLGLFIVLAFCAPSWAKRAQVDTSKVIEVKYAISVWNKDSAAIDSGSVIVKDSVSGKVLQFQIEETAPDSGIFSGNYSVNWGENEDVIPEVYILPNNQDITLKELTQIKAQIDSGAIKRKPIVVRRNEFGAQVLEVFDTKEQAAQALKVLREARASKQTVSQLTAGKAAKALFDSTDLKKFAEEQERLALEIEKKRIDRLREEEAEKQRIDKLKREQSQRAEEDNRKRQLLAIEFAESALDMYRVGKYQESEGMFRKSFELDPNNLAYYFQYGITLYRNNKYNEAIIALQLAKGKSVFEAERLYYLALSYYKSQELDDADKRFREVVATKDKKLGPISSFYCGLIKIDLKKYEEAKSDFQEVLDTSEDPQLDNRAESKMDEIDQILEFARYKEKKFIFSATFGTQYDSNITQISDSTLDQGVATSIGSGRLMSGLGLMWRPLYEKKKEWGLKIRTDYVFTMDDALADTDPFVMNLSAPYTINGKTFRKPSKLEIKPAYEFLYVGQDDSGSPEKYLTGYALDFSNSIVMKKNWYMTPALKTRYDKSDVSSDQDAIRWTLSLGNIYYFDSENKKGVITEVGYGMAHAKGDSFKSSRFDLSALYTVPLKWWDTTFAGGIYYYYLDYSEIGTVNNNYNLVINIGKPITEWLDLSFISTYMLNKSNTDSSEYKRYTIGLILNVENVF